MKKENPKCDICGEEMKEIGGIGKKVEVWKRHGSIERMEGIEEIKLYQCPKDKNVKLD